MVSPQLAHMELLAQIDALIGELRAWAENAPQWPAGVECQALARRLVDRADTLRVRLDAPLVVATLGGTGTGKSALVNALVGEDATESGRQRPTTCRPVLICRDDISPAQLGMDDADVSVVHRNLPLLRDVAILDCPDPDTTESGGEAGTNLDRLRSLLPHCDVLLVTSTQQKYASARVTDELASAAAGAHLVFVQTHADSDDDIRADWRDHLQGRYAVGEMFFVDSLAALRDSQAGMAPRGEFARLVDFLTRELAGAAAHRIRRANFLDLLQETLLLCGARTKEGLPAIAALEEALASLRQQLAGALAAQMRDELLSSRRPFEQRLLSAVATRWGFSPFSLVIRAYLGLGSLLSSAALLRVRTPAQLALWGAMEGARRLRDKSRERQADQVWSRPETWNWNQGELRAAAIVLEGYAGEAGLPSDSLHPSRLDQQAAAAGESFVEQAAGQLQAVIDNLAARHSGALTRLCYEVALLAVLGLVLFRLGKNYFYDSWLAVELGRAVVAAPVFGFDFLVQSAFWLLLWSALLLWLFTARLRRGLKMRIQELASQWGAGMTTGALFEDLETRARAVRQFEERRMQLQQRVESLRQKLAQPQPKLGKRIA